MVAKDFRPDVKSFTRDTFISEVWDYQPGECVTALCPMGGGKTQLTFQLLAVTSNKNLPATVLVMKPQDKTVTNFMRSQKLRLVRDWPPSRVKGLVDRPPGWVLWPTETDDPDADEYRHALIFRRALRDLYRPPRHMTRNREEIGRIIYADETYSLEQEMGLTKDLNRIWTKGRSNGSGLWASSQRPVWISRWALQAQHIFLGFDPDVQMQKRYSEIGGGVDPDAVRYVVSRLKKYEFCYINRDQRAMCIVGA